MKEELMHVLGLGLEPRELGFLQMGLRGVVVFIVALATVRLGNKRFLAKLSAFDAILGFILASVLARAVNGSAAFFPTLGAGFVLVGLHALLAKLSFRSGWIGFLAKGRSEVLVKDGQLNRRQMEAHSISEHDLLEEARLNGQVLEVSMIREATVERNGQVSVVPFK